MAPLEMRQWEDVWPLLHPLRMEEVIRKWIPSVLEGEDQIELAEVYVEPLIQNYGREMEIFFVKGGPAPDPRLMKWFLFVDEISPGNE